MSRLVFKHGEQRRFLENVRTKMGCGYDLIARGINMSGRSLRDWVNEGILGDKDKLVKLSELSGILLPNIIEEREDWWSGRYYGRKAALVRLEKFGIPGSIESRRKGGLISQKNRRLNPEYYRSLGCKVAKHFKKPRRSSLVAEWVGVVLGDGCITKDQCQISLDSKSDQEYVLAVTKLVEDLFGFSPSVLNYPRSGLIRVVVTGVNFVKMMKLFGLEKGNKIKHQVDIPEWIKQNEAFYCACVRGLFDTDGGSFTHKHWVKTYQYRHFGLTFSSASKPLLNSYSDFLKIAKVKHSVRGCNVFIYSLKDVKMFFDVIRPSNGKHLRRFQVHLNSSTRLN